MNQSQSNRDHDGLFRYEYSEPKNAKALLDICRTSNRNLDVMLADVNLDTLERIPEGYNEVGERGEADVCFKAKIFGGKAKSPVSGDGISKVEEAFSFQLKEIKQFSGDILLEFTK